MSCVFVLHTSSPNSSVKSLRLWMMSPASARCAAVAPLSRRRGTRQFLDAMYASDTEMSSRMLAMRFLRGCRRCPSSFPNGAVSSVARQLGHRGFSYRRSALSSICCAQSRWKQCPHACSMSTTSPAGPGRGSGSMHTVHSSGPRTRDRVPQQAMLAAGRAVSRFPPPRRPPSLTLAPSSAFSRRAPLLARGLGDSLESSALFPLLPLLHTLSSCSRPGDSLESALPLFPSCSSLPPSLLSPPPRRLRACVRCRCRRHPAKPSARAAENRFVSRFLRRLHRLIYK
mmetsp:Transcript_18392/g.45745  ORF Transcript_18392/g.45745 Transcript_18392/m.45745 type:complete len:285 (+) Transcript_18392:668-1522(+)